MSNLIVSVVTTTQDFPAGTVPAGITLTVSNADSTQPAIPPVTLAAAPYTHDFGVQPPGNYTCIAQAIDAAGSPLGSPMTGSGTILPPVSIDVPSTVTITAQ